MIRTKVSYIYEDENEYQNHRDKMESNGYVFEVANWVIYDGKPYTEVVYKREGVLTVLNNTKI